jgi:hypothetical protein
MAVRGHHDFWELTQQLGDEDPDLVGIIKLRD